MIPVLFSSTANHLWQSSLFAVLMWLVAIGLRKNRAAVRYGLWLAASVKFLVPYSLLTQAARWLEWRVEAPAAAILPAVQPIAVPFTVSEPASTLAVAGPSHAVALVAVAVWICGVAISGFVWLRIWQRVRRSLAAAQPLPLDLPIPVMTSPSLVEPGVFGIFRPVLLLPLGIAERLTEAQLQSIVAHELCHVRRRDNMAAAVHMVVESIFWFHPLVWWIGGRIVEERELACDKAVLGLGHEPQTYAEGILRVCKFYAQSPLACASGVTGADLKRRITAIVNARISEKLTAGRKALLLATGLAAVAGPLLVGVLRAEDQMVTFEVTSVKPSNPDLRQVSMNFAPGGSFQGTNVSLRDLIATAYNITCGKGGCGSRISGGPPWLESARFDVQGKGTSPVLPAGPTREQGRQQLQALLADRFKLVVRKDTKEMPFYNLVVMSGGHKMRENTSGGPGGVRGQGRGELVADNASLFGLVANLTTYAGRTVVDRTGLTGRYDFRLQWATEMDGGDANHPSLFTALQEQLGLKLEPQKGPVEVLVIERAEKPEAN